MGLRSPFVVCVALHAIAFNLHISGAHAFVPSFGGPRFTLGGQQCARRGSVSRTMVTPQCAPILGALPRRSVRLRPGTASGSSIHLLQASLSSGGGRGLEEGDSVTVIVKTASFAKQVVQSGVSSDGLVGKVISTREEEDMDVTFVTVKFFKEDGSDAFEASFTSDELQRVLEVGEEPEEEAVQLPLLEAELLAASVLIAVPRDYAAQRKECMQLLSTVPGVEGQVVAGGVLVEGKWAQAMTGVNLCCRLLLARGVPGVSAAFSAGEGAEQDDYGIPDVVLEGLPGMGGF